MPHARLAVALTVLGTVAFLLAVFAGCKSDSSSTGVPASITVTGRVITNNNLPVSNLPVVITGRPATATDANGSFTITDVTVPYDVTVAVSLYKIGITYRGLSRSDPTLVNGLSYTTPPNTATISGTLSGGGGYPEPVSRTSRVSLTSAEGSALALSAEATGAYSMTLNWGGGATITAILHALQWDRNASGMPTTFVGYGEKTGLSIASGGSFGGQNITMTAVSSQNISGTVIVPAALVLTTKALSLTFPNNGSMLLGAESGTPIAFTYLVPTIAGTALSITAQAGNGGAVSLATKGGIAPGTTGIVLTIPDPTVQTLPVDAATGVTTITPFTWTPLSSVIYLLYLVGPGGQPRYEVITGGNSGTIPDMTALGLGLPKSASYSWSVTTYGPFTNIDAAAAATGYVPQGDMIKSVSSLRTFTTAP